GRLSLAAVNGPRSVVVSGESGVLDEVVAWAERVGVWARRVDVDYASHSGQVDGLHHDLVKRLGVVVPRQGSTPFYSTVTGSVLDTGELNAEYWYRNLRQTVEFDRATRALLADGHAVFVEVSPHPVLVMGIEQTAEDAGFAVHTVASLRRNEGNMAQFLSSVAEVQVAAIPCTGPFSTGAGTVDLPTYPFQHRHYWLDALPDISGRVPANSVIDRWRYRVEWRPVPTPSSGRPSGTWLVLTDPGDELGSVITAALAGSGVDAVPIGVASGDDRAAVAARIRAVLEDRPAVSGAVCSVGLWSSVVVVQGVVDAGLRCPLWMVTRGASGLGGEVDSEGCAVWGLGQVVGLELPGLWGGMIDVSGGWLANAVGVLSGIGEDQLAVTESGVFARRLVRSPVTAATESKWRARGTALVTGGTGGVGAHVVRWLVRSGVEHVVLVSRRGGAADLVEEARAAGVKVTVAVCDVTDRDALAEVVRSIPDEFPLRSVFHAAGVGNYREVVDCPRAEFVENFSGKGVGARYLDELTSDLDLDAFVLFSSGAATWGSSGQGVYAAANAYLDGLARERRARGLPATSISWGLWGSTEAASGLSMTRLTRVGLRAMDPALAVEAMQQALDHDESLLTVADIDWERFTATYTIARPRPLIQDVAENVADDEVDEAPRASLRAQLTGRGEGEQFGMLLALARQETAMALGHASPDDVPVDKPFRDMGVDSLIALDVRKRLGAATGLRLPTTLVFDYPTVRSVAAFLRAEILGSAPATPVPTEPTHHDDPVAIVGMACRFPGAMSPAELWQLLVEGRDEVTTAPTDRGWEAWDLPGEVHGAFVREAGEFDADFFGISPREALAMDPQQRLLLEVSWEVFERAGIDPLSLRGSRTGAFVGGSSHEYCTVLMNSPHATSGYALTGASGSVLSGRVSYVFGFEGPAVTVDTACSSSLVA
ncbi:SDR family NAD(P)-dependent oxidoreductase, partial [Goodfellowiella coeruleoviolacea]